MRFTKECAGYYRVTADDGRWSNIHKRGSMWHADIRKADGTLKRFAGIWNTLTAAREEAESILREP